MAKKSNAGTGCLIVIVIAFSAISAAYEWALKNKGTVGIIAAAVVALFILQAYLQHQKHQNWVKHLNKKYNNNHDIVNGILNNQFWRGQTAEQLSDSLGSPHSTDKQVMKTKTKEIWKYHETQRGQFQIRITLENNKVVGWEKKGE